MSVDLDAITTRLNGDLRSKASALAVDKKHRRPRDAATMIVYDETGSQPTILMGRRRADLAFMPGKFVFPGGRLDRADYYMPCKDTLTDRARACAGARQRGRPSEKRASALALTAIRETYEETGILLGQSALPTLSPTKRPRHASWSAFLEHGAEPTLSALSFIGRAITPPGRPRRFDTRFFATPVNHIAKTLPVEEAGDGELEEIAWLTFDEARALDLPRITTVILEILEARLATEPGTRDGLPVPFFFARGQRFHHVAL